MESTAAMEAEQMIKRLSQLTDKSNSNHTSDADRTPVATDVQPAHQQEDTEQGAQNSRKYVQDPLLGGKDDKVLKIATFSLQKYLKEREFADEFLSRGGLQSLCEIIRSTSGNTLAYALNSLTSLMEHDHGWATLEIDFITYIVSIVTHKQLVNVCRPATAILIKLICADKTHPNPELQCYGFSVIYAAIKKEPQFLPVLVDRLQSQDYILCLNSLSLLNAMLKHVTDDLRGWFTSELYNFDMRKNILRLMTEHPSDDLTAHLLEFQSLLIRNAHRRRRTQVSFDNPEHVDSLNYIAQVAGLRDDENRWLHLGFTTENPAEEFQQTGLLGLENMCAYVKSNEASFKKMISNQNNVENHRRCPFGRASVEATELLCDYWGITNGYATAIDFQPLVLYYDATHIITVQTIFHFFNEMAATSADFSRVLDLVRSQLKFAMRSADANRCLADFEKSMLGLPYQTIRERRIRELEWADDLLGREAITNLRSRIYKDSYDIVRQQRINCLLQGAWFALPNKQRERSNTLTDRGAQGNLTGPNVSPEGLTSPTTSSNTNENALSIRNRFVRLSTNRKYLHYGDFTDRHPSSKDIEELKERVDISTIKEIQLHNSRVSRLGPPTPTGDQSFRPLSTRLPSNVTISTIKSPTDSTEMPSFTIKLSNTSLSGHSSFTFHCTSHAQFSEWTDGLNLLLDRPITNKVTAEYINTLTEIGVKIKLLSIGGDHMEVPTSSLEIPSIPPGLGEGFFYLDKATPVVATFPISVTVEDNTPSPSPVVSPSTSSSNLRIHQREHEAVHLIDALGNYQNDKNTQQSLASLEHSSDTRQAPAQPPLGPKQRTNWWFHRQDSVPPKPLTHSQLDVIPTDKLQQDASPVVDIATAPELQVTSLDITPADTNALPSTDHDSLKSSQALASPNKKAEAALASTEAALESANIGDSPDHVTDRIINWVPFLKSMPAPDPEHISHQLGSPGGRRRRRSPYHPTSQGHDNAHL